jgi:thiol-disulfide isomerase/thioredoxin
MSPRHPTRRAALLGLIGGPLLATQHAVALEFDPPPFGSARHQFRLLRPQRTLPAAGVLRLDGTSLDLATLRDRAALVNFWATWCAACRRELPLLDQLQARMAGAVRVVAISTDRGGRAAVAPFVRELRLRHLAIGLDPDGRVAHPDADTAPFGLYGMPITYVIAPAGRIIGYVPGEADWTSDAAHAFLEYVMQP